MLPPAPTEGSRARLAVLRPAVLYRQLRRGPILLCCCLQCCCVVLFAVVGHASAAPAAFEENGTSGPPVGLTEEHRRSQWITKLEYAGPEGDFVMTLIFRLEDRDRFSIQARDRLGRTWWDLTVDGPRALSLDRRNKAYCSFDRVVEVTALPLGPLEFTVLPRLILGRLPFQPVGRLDRGEGEWSLQDEQRRTWFAREEGGLLRSWRLVERGRAVIWWSRVGELMVLSAPEEELQLRWRNNPLRELATDPLPLEVPEDYVADCAGDRILDE